MYKRNNQAIFLCLVLTCWIILSISHSSAYCGEADNEKAYVPNEVLVKFKPHVEDIEKDSIRQKVGATLINTIKSIGVEYWRLPEDISTVEAVELLNDLPSVEFAEPNYLYKPLTLPDDTHFNKLWFLHNTGQWVNGTSGIPGADISAAEAWDIETGSHDVVIAVIDSGVAFDHPDLKNNVWVNTKEIPDNGIDDDGNGYIDDVHGWDFVNNDNNPSDYSKDLYGNGHGTHVAGIIAARGNNNLGVTGVMWQAQIMPLQVFDLFESSSFVEAVIQSYNIILAIEYALNNGAKIINMSLGCGHYSNSQYSVLNYADQNGVLVVAAAGNGGLDQIGDNNDLFPPYPASYDLPNIISVAATNELDELSSYSNYGLQFVDVAVPGGSDSYPNIYSTVPPERVTLFYEDFECGLNQWVSNGIYEEWSTGYNYWPFYSYVARDSIYGYHENELSYLRMANPVDATNCRGIYLRFEIAYDLEEEYDYCFFEGSLDGINYFDLDYPITGFSNGIISYREWYSELELGKFYLGLRLETDWLYNYSGVSIDNIEITGIRWVFDGDEYDYKSGTSMAAPVVSGIAGLVWSHNPNLTHHEVKNIILDSVDKLESLDGWIVTGGRVNAYKALLLAQNNQNGSMVTPNLWIRAVINTEEKGAIEAVWQKGGEDTTSRGDRVIWGHFYASPSDVTWGSENNPDLFVKIWFDVSGRVDVNYFHVSVPDIEVYSDYTYDGTPDEHGITTMSRRYIRQYYENGQSNSDENYEDGNPPAGYSPAGNPFGYSTINDLRIGSIINTVEKGPIDAVWQLGGQDTTSRGDQVVWGHFYASPSDVTWGSQNNPDLFVKIWFDVSGRVDVNFFHVSVPDIEVYSDYLYDGTYDQQGTITMDRRYIRQYYENGQSYSDESYEDGTPPHGYSQTGNPSGFSTINDLRIGSMINTIEKGPVDAVWQKGGEDTTSRGDQVVWGHFYASPSDVTWGSENNPDLFVKLWFDVSGRVDVNFFHVSVPDIEVYSDLPNDSNYDNQGTTIMSNRYIRHEYWR